MYYKHVSNFTTCVRLPALIAPDDVLTELNRLLFRFLWRKRDCNRKAFEKVKRVVVCNDIEYGGIHMIDVRQMQAVLLLQWVVRLCRSQETEKWTFTSRLLYSHFGLKNECFFSDVKRCMFMFFVKAHLLEQCTKNLV